jgi:capsular polysaccharide transport system permease protein
MATRRRSADSMGVLERMSPLDPESLRDFYVFAANQYVAEFRFSVTEVKSTSTYSSVAASSPPSSSSPSSAVGTLAAVFGGATGGAAMHNYVVIDYLLSRQAVDELESRIGLRQRFSRAGPPADWWASFDAGQPTENSIGYWNSMVTTSYDPTTNLAAVRVRTLTAADAQAIAGTMATLTEELVNNLEKRVQLDAVKFAESKVDRAQQWLEDVRHALADYCKKDGAIDPTGSVTGNADSAQTRRASISQMRTDLAVLYAFRRSMPVRRRRPLSKHASRQRRLNSPRWSKQSARIAMVAAL